MAPTKLTKKEQWRNWHEDAQEYCEALSDGMTSALEEVKKLKEEVTSAIVKPEWWALRESLYRFLNAYTAEGLRRIVESVSGDNGWEAWRQLSLQCEPSVGMKEAEAMSHYMGMVSHRSKNVKEARQLVKWNK